MANPEHLKILKQGVEAWNKWRQEKSDIEPDLAEANLHGANLIGANLQKVTLRLADLGKADLMSVDLSWADLICADLREANVGRANLFYADLEGAILRRAALRGSVLCGANLRGVNCRRTDFSGADLRAANLSEANLEVSDMNLANLSGSQLARANLRGARLVGALLDGADLTGIILSNTIFANLNLSNTKGLDACDHQGPSILDHRTIIESDSIPLSFLRGIGFPETLINYLSSLPSQDIQFYSCFISHSTKDHDFATRLYNDLQGKGVRCWYAPEEMKGGEKLYDQIDSAIKVHDKLLLVLSDNSINSEWVRTELRRCRKAEQRDHKRKLFPIRLMDFETLRDWECFDADYGKDLAVEVREHFIPDFSNWKDHDAYQLAFDRLLKDLQSSEQEV